MEINEMPGSKPPQAKPFPTSEVEKKIRDIVSGMKESGRSDGHRVAVRESFLLVPKKTGESRLVDYHRLNNQTIKINFPLPTM